MLLKNCFLTVVIMWYDWNLQNRYYLELVMGLSGVLWQTVEFYSVLDVFLIYIFRIIYPWKGFIVRHAFTLVQQLFCLAAQVHLCHRLTQPVISTNIAVRGAAGLLPTQECSRAGSLVMPVPLLSFLFFLDVLNLADTLLSVQLYSCTEQHPCRGIANQALFWSSTASGWTSLNSFRTVDTVTHLHELAAHERQ